MKKPLNPKAMHIEPQTWSGGEQINIVGGLLNSKFSVWEKDGEQYATAHGNNEALVEFLDSLSMLEEVESRRASPGYRWWKVDPKRIIELINNVQREFEIGE